jgi:predicted nucleic acid-binding protein
MVQINTAKSVYIDSNCLMYYFEGSTSFATSIEKLFDSCIDNNVKMLSCHLTLAEMLVLPCKTNNKPIIELYKNLEKHIPNFYFCSVSKEVFVLSAEIRAKYNFRTPDSIHLATAELNNCDLFVSADKKIKGYKGKLKVFALT